MRKILKGKGKRVTEMADSRHPRESFKTGYRCHGQSLLLGFTSFLEPVQFILCANSIFVSN